MESRALQQLVEGCRSGSYYSSWTSFVALLNRRAAKITSSNPDGMTAYADMVVSALREAVGPARADDLAYQLGELLLNTMTEKSCFPECGTEWADHAERFIVLMAEFSSNRGSQLQSDRESRVKWLYARHRLTAVVLSRLCAASEAERPDIVAARQRWRGLLLQDLWTIFVEIPSDAALKLSSGEELTKRFVAVQVLNYSSLVCAATTSKAVDAIRSVSNVVASESEFVLVLSKFVYELLCRSESMNTNLPQYRSRVLGGYIPAFLVPDDVALSTARKCIEEAELCRFSNLMVISEFVFLKAYVTVVEATLHEDRKSESYQRLVQHIIHHFGIDHNDSLNQFDWERLALAF